MNLQETYVIEDCAYYNSNTITSITYVSIPLPSAFELSFTVHRTGSYSNASYLEVGGDTGNTALIGQIGASGVSRIRFYDSEGSSQYTDSSLSNNPLNSDTVYVWIKNGSDNTFSMNDESVEVSNSLTHSKIRKLNITNNSIKGLKVKPL